MLVATRSLSYLTQSKDTFHFAYNTSLDHDIVFIHFTVVRESTLKVSQRESYSLVKVQITHTKVICLLSLRKISQDFEQTRERLKLNSALLSYVQMSIPQGKSSLKVEWAFTKGAFGSIPFDLSP